MGAIGQRRQRILASRPQFCPARPFRREQTMADITNQIPERI
ncbi:(2Fe-2S)-binding protein, partial [Herbaspirillum sp. HC18]